MLCHAGLHRCWTISRQVPGCHSLLSFLAQICRTIRVPRRNPAREDAQVRPIRPLLHCVLNVWYQVVCFVRWPRTTVLSLSIHCVALIHPHPAAVRPAPGGGAGGLCLRGLPGAAGRGGLPAAHRGRASHHLHGQVGGGGGPGPRTGAPRVMPEGWQHQQRGKPCQ